MVRDLSKAPFPVDVLCIGHASFDLFYFVENHPEPDGKMVASGFLSCGGGPAANAAVTVSRLGGRSAFAGFLGKDFFGDKHLEELQNERVDTRLVVRGPDTTPLSTILVKPDGKRSLVNYPGLHRQIDAETIDLDSCTPRIFLLDGHEPQLSVKALTFAGRLNACTVLDAGSVREGTCLLADRVDYLVASERFAKDFSGETDFERAAEYLAGLAPWVVVTLGDKGLIWHSKDDKGRLPAFSVKTVDTTGAGDVFHGAFALGLARKMDWIELLKFASAAAAISCTRTGARTSIPTLSDVRAFLESQRFQSKRGRPLVETDSF